MFISVKKQNSNTNGKIDKDVIKQQKRNTNGQQMCKSVQSYQFFFSSCAGYCAKGLTPSTVVNLCMSLCKPMDYSLPGSCPLDSPGENTRVGCCALLQRVFPTQGWNSRLLDSNIGRRILYH